MLKNVFLRKVRSDKMFSFVDQTWNPIIGCKHYCIYCWARKLSSRFKRQFEPKLIKKRLFDRFKPGKLIFVSDYGDMFGNWVPSEWILNVLNVIKNHKNTYFLFLTKNPRRYFEFKFPDNAILGATIETDIDDNYDKISKAPKPSERIDAMIKLKHHAKFVSIEPILNFSDDFANYIIKIKPIAVAVGYDNYNSKLPEPKLNHTLQLINELRKNGIIVIQKTIRKAWYET